jgi:fatty acid desaturase
MPKLTTVEWPTIALAAIIYAGWLLVTFFHAHLPIWLVAPLGAWLVAWHSSLQHELLHGHPTPWQGVNRALGFVPLSLWLPYDVYHASHLAHHRAEILTNPSHDPESYYWSQQEWSQLGRGARLLLRSQTILVGRLALGPAAAVGRLFIRELRSARTNPCGSIVAWGAHSVGCIAVLSWIVGACQMSPWFYVFGIVYPGISLSLIRSFVEHRAAETSAERTAIVENARILGPLFLFNNLHVVHHDHPGLPWYRIPGWYREHREMLLAKNAGAVYDSYLDVTRRFLIAPNHDPIYPLTP